MMRTVWIYRDTTEDKLVVFDSEEAANAWFSKHDPEGVAFEYPVIGSGNAPATPTNLPKDE